MGPVANLTAVITCHLVAAHSPSPVFNNLVTTSLGWLGAAAAASASCSLEVSFFASSYCPSPDRYQALRPT